MVHVKLPIKKYKNLFVTNLLQIKKIFRYYIPSVPAQTPTPPTPVQANPPHAQTGEGGVSQLRGGVCVNWKNFIVLESDICIKNMIYEYKPNKFYKF
jgi:hypothetical protein